MTARVGETRAPAGDRGARTRSRSIAALVTGRRTKFLVLGFWVAVAVVAAGFRRQAEHGAA
jgi:hypothetical protein